MSDRIAALVCEGQTDVPILKKMVQTLWPSIQEVRSLQPELDELDRHTSFLATVGSASPFIGLFGTVWGIVNSFQAIGASKNTTLAVVAPGIAEALLATAMGLFAAIPAVIFYNFFSNQIRLTSAKLDDFSGELTTILDPAAIGR